MCEECRAEATMLQDLLGVRVITPDEVEAEIKRRKTMAKELAAKAEYTYSRLEPTLEELHYYQIFQRSDFQASIIFNLLELRVKASKDDPEGTLLGSKPDFMRMPISKIHAELAACIDAFSFATEAMEGYNQQHDPDSDPHWPEAGVPLPFKRPPSRHHTDEDPTSTNA